MAEAPNQEETKQDRDWLKYVAPVLIVFAIIATIWWLRFASRLFAQSDACLDVGFDADLTPRFLWTQWACLKAGEVGDLLAGVFAPLAFLWLFVAVIIQQLDLSATLKEIRATSQANKEQAEIARERLDFDKQEQASKHFNASLHHIATTIRLELRSFLRTNRANSEDGKKGIVRFTKEELELDDVRLLYLFKTRLMHWVKNYSDQKEPIGHESNDKELFINTFAHLSSLWDLAAKATDADRARYRVAGIDEIRDAMYVLMQVLYDLRPEPKVLDALLDALRTDVPADWDYIKDWKPD